MSEAPDGKLGELGADAPRVSLGIALRHIRDGRTPVERDRGDVNALAAIFIEETWQRVESWLSAHGRGLPRKATSADGEEIYQIVPPRALLDKAHSDDIIEDIRTNVLSFLDSHVEAWHRFREERRKHPPTARSRHEAHLDELYAVYYRAVVGGMQLSSATDPRYHVKSGLHTAVKTLLNFLKVVPHAYENALHPRTVSGAEARLIAEQGRRTMVTLATMQISYFLALDETLNRPGAEDYDPSKFQVLEEMGYGGRMRVRMKVRDDVLEAVRTSTTARPAPATGCPALVVQGSSGKSVVAAFYEWIIHIAEEQYFPFFDQQQRASTFNSVSPAASSIRTASGR
jgi:hypothetical protein